MGRSSGLQLQGELEDRARARATVGEARGGKREVGCLKVSAQSKRDTLHPPKKNLLDFGDRLAFISSG